MASLPDVDYTPSMAPSKKVFPLTRRVVREAAEEATGRANARAFSHVKTLLVAKDGWLVRVDKGGRVVERVRELPKWDDAVLSIVGGDG
jgi:hypothetical protein